MRYVLLEKKRFNLTVQICEDEKLEALLFAHQSHQ